MSKIIWGLVIVTGLVLLYALLVRPWLRKREWAKPFFANPVIEWLEIYLWSKSESILWARWQQFLGLVLTVIGFLGAIDYSLLAAVVPPKYVPFLPLIPMVLNLTGTIAEALRRDTSTPLAVVALPEVKPVAVAIAVAEAKAANIVAVAAVDVAKQEGTV